MLSAPFRDHNHCFVSIPALLFPEENPMSAHTVTLDTIENFLSQKRLAMIGISRDPKDFTAMLFNELVRRGYEVIPVNPNASRVLDRACYARVQDIEPHVEAALLMTSPDVTESVVLDCALAGVRHIWMYGAGGKGAVSLKALSFCEEHGIHVVPGECPFMFFPNNGFHRLHGFLRK